jgi:Immunity protein Imm1
MKNTKLITEVMTAEWTSFSECFSKSILSVCEAFDLLEKLKKKTEPPFILEFYDPVSRRALGIGIGRNHTVFTYQDSLDPPYYISQGGDASCDLDWYCYGQEKTEYLSRNLVSPSIIPNVLEEFLTKNTRPQGVAWEKL